MFELALYAGAVLLVYFVVRKFWMKKGDDVKEVVDEVKDKLDKD